MQENAVNHGSSMNAGFYHCKLSSKTVLSIKAMCLPKVHF